MVRKWETIQWAAAVWTYWWQRSGWEWPGNRDTQPKKAEGRQQQNPHLVPLLSTENRKLWLQFRGSPLILIHLILVVQLWNCLDERLLNLVWHVFNTTDCPRRPFEPAGNTMMNNNNKKRMAVLIPPLFKRCDSHRYIFISSFIWSLLGTCRCNACNLQHLLM